MKKLRILSVILTISMLLCGSFTTALAEESASGEQTSIVVANATKVSGMFFTRQFGNNTSDIDVRAMIHGYSPVVWETQLNHNTDPMVVKSLEKNDVKQGKEFIFTLCDDLKWNDGSPITAKDFVFGYALQASKAFGEIGGDTDVMQHIVGYDTYANGRSKTLSGVRLLDDYRFSVTVKKDYLPYFYENSYFDVPPAPISVIAPDCEVRDDGKGVYIGDKGLDTAELFTTELLMKTILDPVNGYLTRPTLTCGPYTLTSYDAKTGTVTFETNEYFKGNHNGTVPTIEEVTLAHVLPEDMADKLKNGEIDIINKAVKAEAIDECIAASDEADAAYMDYERLGYAFIGLACEKGPQQFQAVRQAIAYAFDTKDFVKEYVGKYGVPVYGYYGVGQWMTHAADGDTVFFNLTEPQAAKLATLTLDDLNRYDYNTAKALELLVKDGWTLNADGKKFDPEQDTLRYKRFKSKLMPLSFTFGLTSDNEAAASVLKRLQEELVPLGAEIVVETDSYNNILIDYLRENGERKYDMSFLAYNFNSIFDPLMEMDADRTLPGSQNASGLYDNKLLDLCRKLHKTEPGHQLTWLDRWVDFQERYNELLPSIPLYSNDYYDFYPSDLLDYEPDAEASWARAIVEAYFDEAD